MPSKGRNAINTTLIFKRNGVKITPGSKVKIYSDPDQINLLTEISFARGQKIDMEPIRMPAGKIWVTLDPSQDIEVLPDDEIVREPVL